MVTVAIFLWEVTLMPKLLPVVTLTGSYKGFLVGHGNICIEVGSLEWFKYLETNKSFSVEVNGKRLTACKKLSINGFTYWNLKGWDGSVNHHIYIGKADQVTVDKLTEAALAMIAKCSKP
ncbi:hypothetical protein B9T16_25785 [Arthrospira sp. PCC 8006]|uniref:hypothetical protein n=1 Tax=Arthrospira sp. PCC 8006 TaxID=1982224 RepID=UPI00396E685B